MLLAEPRVPTMLEEPRACDEASMVGYEGKRVPNEGMSKHWNRYQVNRVESVSGATGSALEKTRIDAMQYIKTRPNTRFKKNIGAYAILSYLTSIRPVLIGILVYLASNNSHVYPFQISVHVLKKVRGIRRSS